MSPCCCQNARGGIGADAMCSNQMMVRSDGVGAVEPRVENAVSAGPVGVAVAAEPALTGTVRQARREYTE